MSVETAWKLGRGWYRDRLDEVWTPKTPETMTALFREVGLDAPFWNVL